MSKIKFYAIVLILLYAFVGCKNTKESNNNVQITDTVVVADTNKQEIETDLSVEYNSKYICPNHCKTSGSKTQGKCPVCGMDYIENPDFEQ